MKQIVFALVISTFLWAIPALAQADEQMAHTGAAVPDGVAKWRETSASANGLLDFTWLPLPHGNVVAYAFCYLRALEDMDVILKIGSDDGVKVWPNGERQGLRTWRRRKVTGQSACHRERI